jgi:hypothetical protein
MQTGELPEVVRVLSKDQGYGAVIFLISIVVAVVYLVAFFAPWVGLPQEWHDLAVGIPVLLFVLLVLVISGWIGWTMVTTPPPAPLEPEPSLPKEEDSEKENKSTRTKRKK